MAILRNHCVITSQCLQLCKQNLHQLFICSLAITEWVYTFLIPKICPVLSSFFRAGNNITDGSTKGGSTKGGSTKGGSTKGGSTKGGSTKGGRVGVDGGLNIRV